jgi:hypothetical protein
VSQTIIEVAPKIPYRITTQGGRQGGPTLARSFPSVLDLRTRVFADCSRSCYTDSARVARTPLGSPLGGVLRKGGIE